MDSSGWFASLNSGLLPKFQLFVSQVAVVAIANSVQVYLTTKYSERIYIGTPGKSGSPSGAGTRSSRKSTASQRQPTRSNALDEHVDEVSASRSPNTAITRTRPAENTSPVTPFSSRMFGNWTALSGVIRLYCALNISDPLVYQLTLWTYIIVVAHYLLETFVFGTTGPAAGRAILGPAIIGPSSLVWMLMQWSYYVK